MNIRPKREWSSWDHTRLQQRMRTVGRWMLRLRPPARSQRVQSHASWVAQSNLVMAMWALYWSRKLVSAAPAERVWTCSTRLVQGPARGMQRRAFWGWRKEGHKWGSPQWQSALAEVAERGAGATGAGKE